MDPRTANVPDGHPSKMQGPCSTTATLSEPSPPVFTRHILQLLAALRLFATVVRNSAIPTPSHQNWVDIFIRMYSVTRRYILLVLFLGILAGEYEQPGFLPKTDRLSNAILGFSCAIGLILLVVVLQDFSETKKWPWQERGWVSRLWSSTLHDIDGTIASLFQYTTRHDIAQNLDLNPIPNKLGVGDTHFVMPTNALLGSANTNLCSSGPPFLRFLNPVGPDCTSPIKADPLHKSGLLGDSPIPQKFKHFNGDSFHSYQQLLDSVRRW